MFSIKFYNVNVISAKRLLTISNILVKENLFKFSKNVRNISTSSVVHYKLYKGTESTYFRDYMKTNGKFNLYCNTEPVTQITDEEYNGILKENWKGKTSEELHTAFVKLSDYAFKNNIPITLKEFDDFIDNLTDTMEKMDDDKLRSISGNLLKWPDAPSVFTRNLVEIWAALDDILVRRMSIYEPDTILLHADCFFLLSLSRKSDYMSKTIFKMGRNLRNLSTLQFIQTMFYISSTRMKPHHIIEFETKWIELLDNMNMIETAIVCAGFFKSKSIVKNKEFINRLMDKLAKELSNVDDLTTNCVLKCLRSSASYANISTMEKLLDQFVPQIPRFNLIATVQIATLPVTVNLYHSESLKIIKEKFMSNPSEARIKDLERLTLAFTELEYIDKALYDCILEQLKTPERRIDIELHPRSYAICLSYLLRVGVLSEDMISEVLDPTFVEKNYRNVYRGYIDLKNPLGKELLSLDCAVDIELPNYTGNRLLSKARQSISNFFSEYLPDNTGKYHLSNMDKNYLGVNLGLEKYFGGPNYVKGFNILPNYEKGVYIVSIDNKNNPVDLTSYSESLIFGSIIRAPKDSNKWYAFVLNGHYSYLVHTETLTAAVKMKMRQLKKIGYTPIPVNMMKWKSLEEKQKMRFIRNSLHDREIAEVEKMYEICSQ